MLSFTKVRLFYFSTLPFPSNDESIAKNITDLFRTYNVEELLGDLLIFQLHHGILFASHLCRWLT